VRESPLKALEKKVSSKLDPQAQKKLKITPIKKPSLLTSIEVENTQRKLFNKQDKAIYPVPTPTLS
jgi:hypothetical protein